MPITKDTIKRAEELEEELSNTLADAGAEAYDDNTAAYNRLSKAIDEYYASQRKTDATGKLVNQPATRLPAEVRGGLHRSIERGLDNEGWEYHFEPSVAEVQTTLRNNPELIKQYKLERWLQPGATPALSMPMVNTDTGGQVGMNTQPPATFLDKITTDSTPYKKIAEHLWEQRMEEGKARGLNIRRYRDVKLKDVGDFAGGGIRKIVERGLAPLALGIGNANSMGAGGPLYDATRELSDYKLTREADRAREDPVQPEAQQVTDIMSGMPMGTNESQFDYDSRQLPPSSQQIRDKSPGLEFAGSLLGYGVRGNPTNEIQRGLTEMLLSKAGGYANAGIGSKALASAFSGGTTNVAEGVVRDFSTELLSNKGTVQDAATEAAGNMLPNALGGFAAGGLFDLVGQGANKWRQAYREANPAIRTLDNAGGDTRFIFGVNTPPAIQEFIQRSAERRAVGSPGAIAAEEIAPRIRESFDTKDRKLKEAIGDEMEAYYAHPDYGKRTVSGKKLVEAIVEMANQGRFRAPVTGKMSNIDPSLINTINRELGAGWAEPLFVPRQDAARVAAERGGVVVDMELANAMFGRAPRRTKNLEAVIVSKPYTAKEIIELERKIDHQLKSYADQKAPADPVYTHLNRAAKETRDEFPAFEDADGNLVGPPDSEGPQQPFGPAQDLPPKGGGSVSVYPKPIDITGSGSASPPQSARGPEIPRPRDPFYREPPANPIPPEEPPLQPGARPVDVGPDPTIAPEKPMGLLAVGPDWRHLPRNPFEPSLPTTSGLLDPAMSPDPLVEVSGGYRNKPPFLGITDQPPPRTGRMGSPELTTDKLTHDPVYEGQFEPSRRGDELDLASPEAETPLSTLAGNRLAMQVPEREAAPVTQRSPEDATPLSLLAGPESAPREPTERVIQPRQAPAASTEQAITSDQMRAMFGNDTRAGAAIVEELQRAGVVPTVDRVHALKIGGMAPDNVRMVSSPEFKGESGRRSLGMELDQPFARDYPDESLPGPVAKDWTEANKETGDWYEDIVAPGREPRSDEAKRMSSMTDQQRAMEEALGQINNIDKRLGPIPEADKEKMLLDYISKKLGREVTREDLVRAGILAGGLATMTSDDENVQLLGAMTIGAGGGGSDGTRKPPPKKAVAGGGGGGGPRKPTPGGAGGGGGGGPRKPTPMKATLDDGQEVTGLSAMRRRQHERQNELTTARQRVGADSDKTLRDRLIDFNQGDNKIYDDELLKIARELGLEKQLWNVPAAAGHTELKRRAMFGTSGSGFVGRLAQTLGPRTDRVTGVLAGIPRNPLAAEPKGLMEHFWRAGASNPARRLLDITGGSTGARHGDDMARIIQELFGERQSEEERKR